jgi:prepilin-type N-terminal cleavage/methylation domain-containing protein
MAALEAMMTFATGSKNNRAFTLIELILVMLVMVLVAGMVYPSLKGFVHGRNLGNEAQRFLSLTRYGQSRAVSEGIPVELWINPSTASYGLQSLSGYTESRNNAIVYNLDQTVQIGFSPPPSMLTRSNVWTQPHGQVGALTKIRFQPDGFISDTSPENIYFVQPETGSGFWIAETPSHLKYVLQPGLPPNIHR